MKALRALRTLTPIANPQNPLNISAFFHRFYSAQPQHDDDPAPPNPDEYATAQDAVFDSSHFADLNLNPDGGDDGEKQMWDEKYRDRVKSKVFGEDVSHSRILEREEVKKRKAGNLARALLEAALDEDDNEDAEERDVTEEDQKSLSVGIIGAPNAGKSALTNCMVGTKVSAVSRKVNTTTHEVLGVFTKGDTQIHDKIIGRVKDAPYMMLGFRGDLGRSILLLWAFGVKFNMFMQCFFDTPGLMLKKSGFPYNDIKVRNESAWSSINLYDVLIVIFDIHRHITRPDSRVVRLIERMGSISNTSQKRVLCMNKVDMVAKKNDLLKVVEEFKDLPGYDRFFMISGLKGAGIRDLTQYLIEQAVKRPWDEDPFAMSEEVMKNISLEVVREKLLDYVHQEIPYGIEHRLMGWKELRDGSLRIEQHFITPKVSQRKILVGKKGSKIGRIGIEANEELRSIFKRDVHLILMKGSLIPYAVEDLASQRFKELKLSVAG
ncbi:GTP-binding protein ERG [Striga asiatica]|uniref:GTP-binding protein ERG n=1 Tax=Striga asiatica TaxID=4170 RepID=A0A5A7Q7K3_STRAF|nr:GTP-binding protein ERG [Striga asiatica]